MYYGIRLASGYVNGSWVFTTLKSAKKFSEDIARMHGGGVAVWEPFPFSELNITKAINIYHSRPHVFYQRIAQMCSR